MSDPTPSYGPERDTIDALASHWAIRCIQGVPFGETLHGDVSVLADLAQAVLLRGAEIKTLREELATAKSDPGAFIICKEPLSEEVIANARPGNIIAVDPDQRLLEENERLRAALEAIRPRVVKYCPSGIPIIDKALGTQGGGG